MGISPSVQAQPSPTVEMPFWTQSDAPIRLRYDTNDTMPHPFRLGCHESLELQYIQSGHGHYFIAGHVCPFQQHTLLIIRPNESHNLILQPSNPVIRKVMIQIDPKHLRGRWQSDWPRNLLLNESDAAELELILSQMGKELKHRQSDWKLMLELHEQAMFLTLRRVVGRGEPAPEVSPLISQLSTLIESHFAESLTVAGICRHFGYSVNYLPKLFKQITGVGLKHYLMQRRIMEAKRLLETQPALTVNAIAEKVGFSESVTFYRAFKMIAGVVPETYRRFCK